MLTLRLISIVPCMTKLWNFDYCFKSCFLSSRYSACGFVYENISVYMYLFQTQLPSQITILRPESQKVTQILILVDCQNIILFWSNPTFVHTCMHTVMCSKSYLNEAKLTYPTFWVVPLCDFPLYRISDKLFWVK